MSAGLIAIELTCDCLSVYLFYFNFTFYLYCPCLNAIYLFFLCSVPSSGVY